MDFYFFKYSRISSYSDGTRIFVLGRTSKGWYKVRVKNKKHGKEGYMYSKYVK